MYGLCASLFNLPSCLYFYTIAYDSKSPIALFRYSLYFHRCFFNVSVWVKVSLDRICTIKPYALILSTDQCIIFPYGCCALYCCYLMGTAVYAMMRHNHRKLQLHLTTHITLLLMVLGGVFGCWLTRLMLPIYQMEIAAIK